MGKDISDILLIVKTELIGIAAGETFAEYRRMDNEYKGIIIEREAGDPFLCFRDIADGVKAGL